MTIQELTKEVGENAVKHGFWDEKKSFAEIIALCHSELSEALEEDRANKPMVYCNRYDGDFCEPVSTKLCHACSLACMKPEGIAIEMADCIIRILDWAYQAGIDMEAVILHKHEYNKTRPYKHGKAY